MRKRIALWGVAAGTVIGLFMPTAALAAAGPNGTNITTSPVSSVLHVAPGKSITTTLSVQNNAAKPIDIELQLQTFKPYGKNGRAQVVPPKPGSDFVNWVRFSQTSFTAQPGEWQKIQMTISPPPTAALDYYYAVLVKPAVTTASGKTNTLKGYNAILILLNVDSPNAKPQITVTNFSSLHGLYEYLPATFNITAKNTGNIFLAPSGDVYISKSSDFSHTIDTIPVNTAQGNVIPGSSRIFPAQWNNGFPLFAPKTVGGQPITDKTGTTIQHLSWDFTQANKFRFGKYYAKMVFVYNNGQRDVPISAVVSFWVIPWKLGLLVLLFVGLCMFGLYSGGRKLAAKTAGLSKKAKKHE